VRRQEWLDGLYAGMASWPELRKLDLQIPWSSWMLDKQLAGLCRGMQQLAGVAHQQAAPNNPASGVAPVGEQDAKEFQPQNLDGAAENGSPTSCLAPIEKIVLRLRGAPESIALWGSAVSRFAGLQILVARLPAKDSTATIANLLPDLPLLTTLDLEIPVAERCYFHPEAKAWTINQPAKVNAVPHCPLATLATVLEECSQNHAAGPRQWHTIAVSALEHQQPGASVAGLAELSRVGAALGVRRLALAGPVDHDPEEDELPHTVVATGLKGAARLEEVSLNVASEVDDDIHGLVDVLASLPRVRRVTVDNSTNALATLLTTRGGLWVVDPGTGEVVKL